MSGIFDLLGKVNNLDDPEPALNKRPVVLGLLISFLVLAWMCGAFRLYTRFFIVKCPWWDDLFVVMVMATTLVLSIGTILCLDNGLGRHFVTLSLDEIVDFLRAFYIPNAMYPMATAFIKLALLFQYLRIFELHTVMRRTTIFFIVITALWGLAYSILALVPCYPVSAFWNWTVTDAVRWGFGSHDQAVFADTYISHVASNVALDLIVFALPIPLYFNPLLDMKARVGLFCLNVLGVFVNVFSIWRLISIVQTRAGTYPTLDPSWYGSVPIVLAALEVDLALVCASLPIFWPIIEKTINKILVTREVEIVWELHRPESGEAELFQMPIQSPPSPVLTNHTRMSNSSQRWPVDPMTRGEVSKWAVESNGHVEVRERRDYV